MAINKARLFDKKQIRTAELAKALGHPARIAILKILARRGTCICGNITDELPLAQSTVSQHLKALKKAGIIKGTIDGVRTCYCLDKDITKEMNGLLSELTGSINNANQTNCC